MHLTIINGPNLNLLGTRETDIYGNRPFDQYLAELRDRFPDISFEYFQSNHEGLLIDKLHSVNKKTDGIILNAAAFAHTSIAIADAIAAIETPVIEVHISNIYARESFRHHSYTASKCIGVITGLGLEGYALAIAYLKKSRSKT